MLNVPLSSMYDSRWRVSIFYSSSLRLTRSILCAEWQRIAFAVFCLDYLCSVTTNKLHLYCHNLPQNLVRVPSHSTLIDEASMKDWRLIQRVYRKQVKALIQSNGTRKTQVERVLVLLIESGFIYCAIWVSSWYFVDNVYPVTQNSIMQIIFLSSFLASPATTLSLMMESIMESIIPFIAVNTALLLMTLRLTELIIGYLSSDHHPGGRTSKVFPAFHDRVTHSTWTHSVRFTSYILLSTGLERAG